MPTNPLSFQDFEPIIGLEIHTELNTQSKLFSGAANRFGDEPNTNITEVCTGQPGSLPVLNKEAVRKAVRFGCAVGAKVAPYSRFDRKSYFYPDLPKNFQITQFDKPIVIGGSITADVGETSKTFRITRAHLEEDAGMLKHFSDFSGVDYNRAGVPLLEIVSDPCIHSPEEAVAYAQGIKAILQYIDASDCNMEEGSLRIDANVSVRRKGEKGFRNKVEIKNMNSFNFLYIALQSEIKRQISAYLKHNEADFDQVITQSTYRFDVASKKTVLMRLKEDADDYRYFLEPDIPPLVLEEEYIEAIRSALPELPYAREKRYIETLSLPMAAAGHLAGEKALAEYFEEALVACHSPKSVCNWLIVEFAGRFKESGQAVWKSGIPARHVGELVALIEKGTITGKIAKLVADEMVHTPGKSPQEIVAGNSAYQPVHDISEIEPIVDQVLEDNPDSVAAFKGGKVKALAFLVGQVMKETRGAASPKVVNDLLHKKLDE